MNQITTYYTGKDLIIVQKHYQNIKIKKYKFFKKVVDKPIFVSYNITRCVRESTAKTSKEVG